MAGGAHIIIRNAIRVALDTEAVKEQLGPLKRQRADNLLATDVSVWSNDDVHFALRCLRDAHEAYE